MRPFRALSALAAVLFFASGASAVTIDFEGSPLTGPFGGPDWIFGAGPDEECEYDRARMLDDEYASQGVVLSPVFPMLSGGGFEPDGTPDVDGSNTMLINESALAECPATYGGLAPLTITFSTGQSIATFDVFMTLYEVGESFPLDLLDSFGNSFSTMTLTPADAVIPGGIIGGRFQVSSGVPFFGLRIGLTTTALGPGTAGFFFDNLFADNLVPSPLLHGKKLIISNPSSGPANNKLVFVSKDPNIETPVPVDADPRCIPDGGSGAGGALVVNSATTGEGFSISLPCGNWKLSGGAYRYRDASDTTCNRVLVKAGMVKAVCKGPQVLYDLGADQVSVDVKLRIGTTPRKYCTSFNATTEGCDVKKNGTDNRYLAKNCISWPATCTASPSGAFIEIASPF